MSKVEHRVIVEADAGQRLDRWFRRQFPHVTQGALERMLRRGEIRVDGGRVRASTRIETGQSVRIPPMKESPADVPETASGPVSTAWIEQLRDRVIFRDQHMAVLDKPAGLAVQGGTGQSIHLDQLLEHLFRESEERPRLVHRIDRETSGLLVVALTREAAVRLTADFRGREIDKRYLAVISGEMPAPYGEINLPLVSDRQKGHDRMVAVGAHDAETLHPEAQIATTRYATLAMAPDHSFLELRPITGRKHQIRAHLVSQGCPILGDRKYGCRAVGHKLHLHAAGLCLIHPVSRKTVCFSADLPTHMMRSIEEFGWADLLND